jgi:hypothetical protein
MFPFTTRSGQRAGAGVLAGAAALSVIGATALPVAASSASQDIRQVPCTASTFNVYYGANSIACYEGTGELAVQLHEVHKITTGENTGYVGATAHGTLGISKFFPREIISFFAPFPATLTLIDITSA